MLFDNHYHTQTVNRSVEDLQRGFYFYFRSDHTVLQESGRTLARSCRWPSVVPATETPHEGPHDPKPMSQCFFYVNVYFLLVYECQASWAAAVGLTLWCLMCRCAHNAMCVLCVSCVHLEAMLLATLACGLLIMFFVMFKKYSKWKIKSEGWWCVSGAGFSVVEDDWLWESMGN